MPDFTPHTLRLLLTTLKAQNYTFQIFAQFLKDPAPRAIVLRHDVDARKMNSLQTAKIEAELGIVGTYNFRIVPQSFNPEVIREIVALGHEIGYHYEDLALAAKELKGQGTRDKGQGTRDKGQGRMAEEKLYEMAIRSFEKNLEILRRVVPVETICMHGSPLSKYDNRKLWERYHYRDYGIIGEPYFDMDFSKVLYLTDTGRRWDGERFSVRDKVREGQGDGGKGRGGEFTPTLQIHSTFDIVHAANNNHLPDQIMITIHPQRWDDRPWPWIREFVWQNVKNVGKRVVVKKEG